jgi:hypothetical protein
MCLHFRNYPIQILFYYRSHLLIDGDSKSLNLQLDVLHRSTILLLHLLLSENLELLALRKEISIFDHLVQYSYLTSIFLLSQDVVLVQESLLILLNVRDHIKLICPYYTFVCLVLTFLISYSVSLTVFKLRSQVQMYYEYLESSHY